MEQVKGYTLSEEWFEKWKEIPSANICGGSTRDFYDDTAENNILGLCIRILSAQDTSELEDIPDSQFFSLLDNWDKVSEQLLAHGIFSSCVALLDSLRSAKNIRRKRIL